MALAAVADILDQSAELSADHKDLSLGKWAGGLLRRVQNVSRQLADVAPKVKEVVEAAPVRAAASRLWEKTTQRIQNITREDVVAAGASMGMGFAAKAGAFALLGIATGGTGYAALGAAALGGAIVGMTKSAVRSVRENRKAFIEKAPEGHQSYRFFSRETLKSTASSMAISVATLGWSEILETTTGINLSQVFSNAAGHVAELAKAKAEYLAGKATDKLIDMLAQTQAFQRIQGEVMQDFDYANSLGARKPTLVASYHWVEEGKTGHKGIDQNTRNKALQSVSHLPSAKPAAVAASVTPAAPAVAPAVAPVVAPVSALPAVPAAPASAQVVPLNQLPNIDMSQINPDKVVVKVNDAVDVQFPPRPDATAEFDRVKDTLQPTFLRQVVEQDYKLNTGEAAPANADLNELAKQIKGDEGYMASAKEVAEAKAKSKLAATCLTNLPNDRAAYDRQSGFLPTNCVVALGKEVMNEGDYVLVRDVAEANPSPQTGRGLRAVFAAAKESTTGFIGRFITPKIIPEMAAEKLTEKLAVAAP